MGVNTQGPRPTAIDATDDGVRITWGDGTVREHGYRLLRLSCRCARCVEEATGRALLDASTVPEDIHAETIEPVGHYAIRIRWSDGHDTGIFSFAHLRGLPADRGEEVADRDI